MKIIPVASPTQIPVNGTPEATRSAKAIAAFNRGASSYDATPAAPQGNEVVRNQNQIQPEELGAIQAQGQTDSTEQVVEESQVVAETEQTEEKPQDPALSRQFAQLARQEKALRAKAQQQEQAFRAREEALKAKEASFSQAPKADYTGYISKDQLKNDPLSVFAEAGIAYDDLVQQLVNQPTVDPRMQAYIQKLEAKVDAIEEKEVIREKTYQEQQAAQYQAAVKQIETDVKTMVYTDPNYETIKAYNATKDVVELITETYKNDGVLLTNEEAAQQVEDYLVEQAMKIAKLSKVQKKLQTVAPTATASKAQQPLQSQSKQQQPMKTLTNATSSTRQLTAKERALLAFKGELHKS